VKINVKLRTHRLPWCSRLTQPIQTPAPFLVYSQNPPFLYNLKMFVTGRGQIPNDLLCLILGYEGSIVRDFQLDYIGSIYIDAYRKAFGCVWTYAGPPVNYNVYMSMALHIHSSKKQWLIKRRKSRKFMLPWRRAFRQDIEAIVPYVQKLAFSAQAYWEPSVLERLLRY